MSRPTVRRYELLVWPEPRAKRDGDPALSVHQLREIAEAAADRALEANPAGDAQVWAKGDGDEFLVYRLEGSPKGVLITRLHSRLRHPRPVNPKQWAALLTVARAGGQAVRGSIIRQSMGRYATNSFNSCGKRGWLVETAPSSDEWLLTPLGQAVLEEQEIIDAPRPALERRRLHA